MTAESALVGQTLAHGRLGSGSQSACSRSARGGTRIGQGLASVRLHAGEVMVLRSASPQMPDRLGAPLSLLVVVAGLPPLMLFWPLGGR